MCVCTGVSDNHLDVIPTAVYEDITVLTREHIPLLEAMYARGRACILQRNIPWINGISHTPFAFAIGHSFMRYMTCNG